MFSRIFYAAKIFVGILIIGIHSNAKPPATLDSKHITQLNVKIQDLQKQLSQLQKQLEVPAIQVLSKAVDKANTRLQNLHTDLSNWGNFENISAYLSNLPKPYHLMLKEPSLRHLMYQSLLRILIVLVLATITSTIAVKAINSSCPQINTYLSKSIFYFINFSLNYLTKMWSVISTNFDQLLYVVTLSVLGVLFATNALKAIGRINEHKVSIRQRILLISIRAGNIIALVGAVIFAGYYWNQISEQNILFFKGAKQLFILNVALVFLWFVFSVKKYVNFMLARTVLNMRRSLTYTVFMLWDWIAVILVWLTLFMISTETKQMRPIAQGMLTILVLSIGSIAQRGIRLRLLQIIAKQSRHKKMLLFSWYKNLKKYLPILNASLLVLIIARIWDLTIKNHLTYLLTPSGYSTAVNLLWLFAIIQIAQFSIDYVSLSYGTKVREPVRQLFTVVGHGVVYMFSGIYFLIILGFNTTWIGASVSFFSVGVAFGVRDILNDILAGFLFILDNSFSLGDTLVIEGVQGTLEELSIFTFKLRLDSGLLMTYRYGFVQKLGSKSKNYCYAVLNVSVSYEVDPDEVVNLLTQAYQEVKNSSAGNKILAPIEIKGIDKISNTGLTIQARVRTTQKAEISITRMLNLQIKKLFEKAEINLL